MAEGEGKIRSPGLLRGVTFPGKGRKYGKKLRYLFSRRILCCETLGETGRRQQL